MQEKGKIIKIKRGNAIVRVNRKSACASCGMCAIKPNDLYIDVHLKNTLNAQVDDTVIIDMASGSIAKMSMVAYLLPLLFAILCLVVVYLLSLPEWLALIAFFVGLTIGTFGVAIIDKKIYQKSKNRPQIVKIVDEKNINSEDVDE